MACLSNGNSSSSPFDKILYDKIFQCVLWQGRLKMAHTARLAFSSFLGPEKSLQSSTTGTLPEEVVWHGLTDALARSWSSGSEEIFSGPKYDEKTTPIGSANTRSHFGPCNSLRIEMAPWRDWTSLTYVWPLSVEGDLPLKYRSREISSKQYGAGQCQQISDVFLKQGRSFL